LRLSVAELHRGGSNGCSKLELTEECVLLHVLIFADLRLREDELIRIVEGSLLPICFHLVHGRHIVLLLLQTVPVPELDILARDAEDREREPPRKTSSSRPHEGGHSTNNFVLHAYGGDLVARGCRRRPIVREPDQFYAEPHDGGREHGGVRIPTDQPHKSKGGDAPGVGRLLIGDIGLGHASAIALARGRAVVLAHLRSLALVAVGLAVLAADWVVLRVAPHGRVGRARPELERDTLADLDLVTTAGLELIESALKFRTVVSRESYVCGTRLDLVVHGEAAGDGREVVDGSGRKRGVAYPVPPLRQSDGLHGVLVHARLGDNPARGGLEVDLVPMREIQPNRHELALPLRAVVRGDLQGSQTSQDLVVLREARRFFDDTERA